MIEDRSLSINDLLSTLNTFGNDQIVDTKTEVSKLIGKNLDIINKLIAVGNLAGINREHCLNDVNINDFTNALNGELTTCIHNLKTNGKSELDNGLIRLQQINNKKDNLKSSIESCKNNGYPIDCSLQIFAQTSLLKIYVYSIEVDEKALILNGNTEVNRCSITTLYKLRNRIKPVVDCLLGE